MHQNLIFRRTMIFFFLRMIMKSAAQVSIDVVKLHFIASSKLRDLLRAQSSFFFLRLTFHIFFTSKVCVCFCLSHLLHGLCFVIQLYLFFLLRVIRVHESRIIIASSSSLHLHKMLFSCLFITPHNPQLVSHIDHQYCPWHNIDR